MEIYSLVNCMAHDHQNFSWQFQRVVERCSSEVLGSDDEEADGETREDENGDEVHPELFPDSAKLLADLAELFDDLGELLAEVLADGACQVESSCCVCCCHGAA